MFLLRKGESKLENYAVSMRGITKAFGTKVIANKDVDFDLKYGSIVSLLGENGSGKTLTTYLADVDDDGTFTGETEVIKDGCGCLSYKRYM